MRGCFGVGRRRYGGGLALLWDASLTLHVQSYSQYHIDAHVFQDDGLSWRFTGFYEHPEAALRPRTWELLRKLKDLSNLPWMLLGDFNEIVALEETCGRDDQSLVQMAGFRDVLADCELEDLGFLGPKFTWYQKRDDGALVRVQLDCGVATSTWRLLFPNVTVRHVVVANSDHMGLLLKVVTTPIRVQRKKRRLFRFEHVWVREGSCKEVILEAWSHIQVGTPMFRLVQKIKQCRIKLL